MVTEHLQRKEDALLVERKDTMNVSRRESIFSRDCKTQQERNFPAPRDPPRLRYIRNCAVTVTPRARSNGRNVRTHLSMMKLPAGVHMRRATLPPMPLSSVVVIKFGGESPAKEKNQDARAKPGGSSRNALVRSRCIHPRAFSILANLFFLRKRAAPRRAGWIGARRCADRRGLFFSLSADENERYARGGVGCLALRRASEPARGATYPTRGSKLTERTPEREGAGGEADVGRRSTATRETATCRGCGVPLSASVLAYPDGVGRMEDIYLNLLRLNPLQNEYRSKARVFRSRGFAIKLKPPTRANGSRSGFLYFNIELENVRRAWYFFIRKCDIGRRKEDIRDWHSYRRNFE